jgi:hypothetical protein
VLPATGKVLSVEPSSITTISQAAQDCSITESTALAGVAAGLQAGMITENPGAACLMTDPHSSRQPP